MTPSSVLICTAVSLVLGVLTAAVYMVKNRYTKSFVVTLALLPAIVQIVIMLVNGNIGTGVAVAGAFSLIRFRSVPGTARDIGCIFFAMAIGIATGMGYLFYAGLFFVVVAAAYLALTISGFGDEKQSSRTLRITIPEDMDYENLFDDLFTKYTDSAELDRVKTTNMGSLFELRYFIRMKNTVSSKAFLDDLRCRNGNLSIVLGRPQQGKDEL